MIWDFKSKKSSTALIDEKGNELSYYELDKITSDLSEKIDNRSLILCLSNNSVGSILGYLSFLNNSHVAYILDRDTTIENVYFQIEKWQPSYIWLPTDRISLFENFSIITEVLDYSLLKLNTNPFPLHPELALLISTSGSTGDAKLIRLTYKNILSNTISIIDYLKINKNHRSITSLPIVYGYGLSVLHTHLYQGASMVITAKNALSKQFWDLVSTFKVTTMNGVPFHYNFFNKIDFLDSKYDSIKIFTQAGGRLPLQLKKQFTDKCLKKEIQFFIMYGQTEATTRISYLPASILNEKDSCIGIPILGGKIEIRDEERNLIITPNQIGELVYFGKNVSPGFAEDGIDLAAKDINKGVLYTGDLASFDEKGLFYFEGRKNRIAKLHGVRVSLDEIEKLILAKFSELNCACISKDEKMHVFIENSIDFGDVKDFVCNQTNLSPNLIIFHEIEKIPRSLQGKILYNNLIVYNA